MNVKVAYFSAEFGLDESLPIYSGGLGVLAGDHVKTANDLNLSLVGIGILYRKGYFQQRIHPDGTQEAVYLDMDPHRLPVEPVLTPEGEPLLIRVPIAERMVHLRIWRAKAGQVSVYLMDADNDANPPADRRLTDALYGGNQETRISHELILGIGGVRVLTALGIKPEVWHMNEGHVAFLTLERIREYVKKGILFETALEAVKASTVFTTHTPVPAGHDQFSYGLVERYLRGYWGVLERHKDKILGLGFANDKFNMTRFAVRTSTKVNGVSHLHGEVTKELFHQWTPDIPKQDIPVEAITNGVHIPTWLAPELKSLYQKYLPSGWESRLDQPETWLPVEAIPDAELWNVHQAAKRRMSEQLQLPDLRHVLAIGFARRFATYKRAYLLFQDLDRLDRIVNHPERKVCFIFAGKAHPADRPGQDLIRRIAEVKQMGRFQNRIFLVENYDMRISKPLVQGVDVWLNTPVKPMEASGTSGQKAGINGVLNCSVMDGWWDEGYNGRNGWAIPGSLEGRRDEQDREDANVLFQLLEMEIAALYYKRSESNVPVEWVRMMKESIQSITPLFSTSRMVAEYRDRLYLPVAARGKRFISNQFEVASRVADYKQFIRRAWDQVDIESIELLTNFAGAHGHVVQAKVRLGEIWHKDVRVEAVGSNGFGGILKYELRMVREIEKSVFLYEGFYPNSREAWRNLNTNVRVTPVSSDFSSDFELELARWGTQWR